MFVKIDRHKIPCVETEGTILCDICGESYKIDSKQKLHSIIVTTCPNCGHQNINVITNSIKFIDETIEKIKKLESQLKKLKRSLEIEMQENSYVDNYPEVYAVDKNKQPNPKLL
ncbi:hypothetical protein [Thermosipho atlanticus]|uniref:Uncharacterized protein n=1 Tax=Thermosipho atlanticus DSM 15807 TaxID=1123380 RepID=A0A1M5S569_9BACT|nr:hypothetical protein [Thermosipho atlanticus]SHH33619.1 hypothetical protein SAMN02745199_0805 [Thermosipho atlanticus DSM 15807]